MALDPVWSASRAADEMIGPTRTAGQINTLKVQAVSAVASKILLTDIYSGWTNTVPTTGAPQAAGPAYLTIVVPAGSTLYYRLVDVGDSAAASSTTANAVPVGGASTVTATIAQIFIRPEQTVALDVIASGSINVFIWISSSLMHYR